MSTRGGSQRDDARHWLPTQGVDPAPLTELNAECLGLLVLRAGERDGTGSLPPLLGALTAAWARLPAHAVRRLAAAPYSLFDAGFGGAPRWLEQRGRGVHDQQPRHEARYFDSAAARSITRRMLVYGWHLARSRPRAACLVFGITIPAAEALAACSLTVLEAAAETNAATLRPRWTHQPAFWRALLEASSEHSDGRLQELLLGGIQRLAAETMAAHSPEPDTHAYSR
jgi:hypothetical protein